MILFLYEKLVLIYKFCAFYMFAFDWKKVMNHIKSGLKTFENFFGRVALWVDLTYLEKLDYFDGGYPNSKLIYN